MTNKIYITISSTSKQHLIVLCIKNWVLECYTTWRFSDCIHIAALLINENSITWSWTITPIIGIHHLKYVNSNQCCTTHILKMSCNIPPQSLNDTTLLTDCRIINLWFLDDTDLTAGAEEELQELTSTLERTASVYKWINAERSATWNSTKNYYTYEWKTLWRNLEKIY